MKDLTKLTLTDLWKESKGGFLGRDFFRDSKDG